MRSTLKILETIHLPTDHGVFNMSIISSGDEKEHIVLERKENTSKPPLVRIHSECLTGDIFSSHRCDCGEQLEKSLKIIGDSDYGYIFYLRQEGRGIGLLNKMKSYNLQEQGYDTIEANHMLGFETDLREYQMVVDFLTQQDIDHITLITNNPEKCDALRVANIKVDRQALPTTTRTENQKYKAVKVKKMGHFGH